MSNIKPGHLDHPVEVHGPEGGPPIGSVADTREHGEPVHVCRKLGKRKSIGRWTGPGRTYGRYGKCARACIASWNKSRAKGRSPWVENLAILDGRGRNRMRGKSMDLRSIKRLGSMVVTMEEMLRRRIMAL